MPYFLSNKNLALRKEIEVSGDEAAHILLSHRVKKGETIKLQGPDGGRYLVKIIDIDRYLLKCKVLEPIVVPKEPLVAITLFQSAISEKAQDFIFQKGTELGLNKIVLFNSKNIATKLSSEAFKKKKERWNKILIESAKQSERAVWPSLEFLSDVDEVISAVKNLDKVFLTDISGEKFSTLNPVPSTLALLVGPEGGFTPDETAKFKSLLNVQSLSLGPILLRSETAALASLAVLRSITI